MSKVCELTGTTVQYGNNVSHANNRTRRRFLPNLQKKRVWVAEEGKFVTVKATARALRTLDKKGYTAMMLEMKLGVPEGSVEGSSSGTHGKEPVPWPRRRRRLPRRPPRRRRATAESDVGAFFGIRPGSLRRG